jgi:hypothetical protein
MFLNIQMVKNDIFSVDRIVTIIRNNLHIHRMGFMDDEVEDLMGWPALGDGYCNVERPRSWTGFKVMYQRARALGPVRHPLRALPILASSGSEDGRPGHLAGLAREAWD